MSTEFNYEVSRAKLISAQEFLDNFSKNDFLLAYSVVIKAMIRFDTLKTSNNVEEIEKARKDVLKAICNLDSLTYISLDLRDAEIEYLFFEKRFNISPLTIVKKSNFVQKINDAVNIITKSKQKVKMFNESYNNILEFLIKRQI